MDKIALEEVASFLQWLWEQMEEREKSDFDVLSTPMILLDYADAYVRSKGRKGTSSDLVERLYESWCQYRLGTDGQQTGRLKKEEEKKFQWEMEEIKEDMKELNLSEEKKEFMRQMLEHLSLYLKSGAVPPQAWWNCQYEFHGFLIGMGEGAAQILELFLPYPQIQLYLGL